jgi:AraC-like DNA-binding protein
MERQDGVERTRKVTSSTDAERAGELLPETHGPQAEGWTVEPSERKHFAFRHTVTGSALVSLQSTRITGTVEGELNTGSDYVVAWLKTGRGVIGGVEVGPAEPVLYPEGDFSFEYDGFDKDLLHVNKQVVEQVAADRNGWPVGPIEFDGGAIQSGEALSRWWRAMRTVAESVISRPPHVTVDEELAVARSAAVAVLDAFPYRRGSASARRNAPSRIEAAEAFIREHLFAPITTAEVAAAIGLSPRGVQQLFQRERGTTPTAFLRIERMRHARRLLLDAEPGSTTVSEIASACGFAHMGRFAGAYAEEFGESPSATLRARP